MKRKALLALLVELFPDVEKKELFAEILCGRVKVNGETIKDPKRNISVDSQPEIAFKKYVSRGGYKLERVLSDWNISVDGRGFLDAGSSTGGFTDCLLQGGASFVHAVDVGYNQLNYRLRVHERVYVHERTNIMHLEKLDPEPYAAVADLSFRSITNAAAKLLTLVSGKMLIALVKPQFEIRNPGDDFDGVLREPVEIYTVVSGVLKELWHERAFVERIALSPLRGRKGNQELLFLITNNESCSLKAVARELKGLLETI